MAESARRVGQHVRRQGAQPVAQSVLAVVVDRLLVYRTVGAQRPVLQVDLRGPAQVFLAHRILQRSGYGTSFRVDLHELSDEYKTATVT